MKKGIIMIIISLTVFVLYIIFGVVATYQFRRDIGSYWALSVKASTIDQKEQYINKFVYILKNQGFEGKYDAIFLTTADNSFDYNMIALESLQQRLSDIKGMDVKLFEYQTAIQQITEQKQDGAGRMLSVFAGVWMKTHYFMLWDWICVVNVIIFFAVFILGIIFVLFNLVNI